MKVVPISIWSLPWGRGGDSPPRGPLEPRGSIRAHVEGSMSVAAFPHRGQGFPALAPLHPVSVSLTVGHLSGQAGASVVALQNLSRPRPTGCCARLDRTCCAPARGDCLAEKTLAGCAGCSQYPEALHGPFDQWSRPSWARICSGRPGKPIRRSSWVQAIQFLDVRDPARMDPAILFTSHFFDDLLIGSHRKFSCST